MRDAQDLIVAEGGQLLAVGMGTPAKAADTAAIEKIPFPLLVDPGQELYRALGARRKPGFSLLDPTILWRAVQAIRRGYRQHGIQGDPKQLGTTAIIDRTGDVVAQYSARHVADHASVAWVLDQVRKSVRRSAASRPNGA